MASEVRAASLTELGEGGGGFIGQDKDCILSGFKFITGHQFKKKDGAIAGKPATVLSFDLTVKEPDDDDHKNSTQFMIIGDPEHYKASSDNKAPSDEGPFLVLTGTYDNIWNKSPYGVWIAEFINNGLDPAVIAPGINKLNGVDVHLVGKALAKGKNAPPDMKERTILIVEKINAMPGEKAGKAATAAKTAGKTAPVAAAAAVGNGADLDTEAHTFVRDALAKAGGTLSKKDLTKAVFALTAGAKLGKHGQEITKRVNDDEFLSGLMDAGLAMYDPSADGAPVTAL